MNIRVLPATGEGTGVLGFPLANGLCYHLDKLCVALS